MQSEPKELKVILHAFKSPLTYIVFILLSAWGIFYLNTPTIIGFSLFFAILLALMIQIDLKYMILPDTLNILLFILGFTMSFIAWGSFLIPFLGAVFGFSIFFFIFYVTFKLKGEPSMGFGDVKFITALGAWVGPLGIPLILIYASLLAGLFVIFKSIFKGKFENKPFPYGPFLAVSGWLAFLYSTSTWNVILKLREQILGIF